MVYSIVYDVFFKYLLFLENSKLNAAAVTQFGICLMVSLVYSRFDLPPRILFHLQTHTHTHTAVYSQAVYSQKAFQSKKKYKKWK